MEPVATIARKAALALPILMCAVPAAAEEQVLVEAGSAMTYLANATDPGIGMTWTEVPEPAGWDSGSYGVGYDNSGAANALLDTIVPNTSRSIYTRTTFNIPDAGTVFSVFLGADYDDGIVAWINGVEVYRSPEMRSRTLTWDVLSGDHESSNGATPDYEPLRNISAAALPALVSGDNVLAVGVWNSTVGSSDEVLVPRLLINRMLTRAPYLQQGGPNGVTVRWRTGEATDSRVLCGPQPTELSLCFDSPTATTEHVVDLRGLDPNTRYYYAVGHSVGTTTEILAGGDADHFFDTAPATGTPKPTRVWVLGDSGTGNLVAERVRDAYLGYTGTVPTEFWLMLGDNAYNTGTDLEYQENLFDIYPGMLRKSVLWPTIGNHDSNGGPAGWPYFDIFTLPDTGYSGGVASGTEHYYSFDFGNIHLIVLDSLYVSRQPGSPMLTWLAADLASTNLEWIVAFWHHPPYSKGGHDSDNPPGGQDETPLQEMRENVVPILEQHGADLVLSGHSHSYERSFLIDGHYGDSTTFLEVMKVDGGSGNIGGDGAYVKPEGITAHAGEVFAVAGSSGTLTPGKAVDLGGTEPNHPAMYTSQLLMGSMVLDFNGNRLDARFLDIDGNLTDYFTMFKGGPTQPPLTDFQGTPLTVGVSQDVTFNDLTQNEPTVWDWDFEDDGQSDSNQPDPTHRYEDPGRYAVRLAVSNSAGVDETTKTDYICVTGGVPAEVTGLTADTVEAFSWVPDPLATDYDVVKGDLIALHTSGALGGTQLDCLTSGAEAELVDTDQPDPGEAFYYLARGANCEPQAGSYDTSGEGQVGSRDLDLQGTGQCGCAPGTDVDGDGACDAWDNCPGDPNPSQADSDGDGFGNACDNCPDASNPGQFDGDGDGVGEVCDNCRWVYNPGQIDGNANDIGDVCECQTGSDCNDNDPCTQEQCIKNILEPIGQCRYSQICP